MRLGRSRPRYRGNPNAISPAALSAAGFRVTKQNAGADTLRRLIQPWQARAFGYYDQLGAIKFASQFYARMLSQLRLYVAKQDEDGDWNELEKPYKGDDALAQAALDRIQDPGGTTEREVLLSSYGRLMFIAGESYLFESLDPDTSLERWEFLSTDELRVQGDQIYRYRAPALVAEEYEVPDEEDAELVDDEDAQVYRIWQRHPRWSWLADSTMAGVLDDCERLLLLTRAIRSSIRSRIASRGILAISEDFSYAPLEPEPDEDPTTDPFMADFIAAGLTAIQNEGSASAALPLILRGPTSAIKDGIKHIVIADPAALYPEIGQILETVRLIAVGLDLPPEILLGLADVNHWGSFIIDERTWKDHGQPKANQLCNDLNTAYFLPDLRESGVGDWRKYRIQGDASAIVSHPDRTKDVKEAYQNRVVGKKLYRETIGVSDDDAPTDEELQEMIGVAVHDGSLALFGEPSVKAGGVEVAPGEIVSPSAGGEIGATTKPAPRGAPDVQPGPPKGGPREGGDDGPPGATASATPSDMAMGAIQLAFYRAREAAGNRLKSLAKRDEEALELIDGVPTRNIAAKLGPIRAKALGADADSLVKPAFPLLLEAFQVFGIPRDRAEVLAGEVERQAARTLFDQDPSAALVQIQSKLDGMLKAP